MGILNVFDYLTGLILFPFQWFHPFAGLIGVCIAITVIGMVVYKKVTDQKKLKYLQTQVKLVLMEMRLRHHSVGELIGFQFEAFVRNFRYLKTAFIPSLIIVIPIILMLPSIDARFQYLPARIGSVVSVEVILSGAEYTKPGAIKLTRVPDGLKLLEEDRGENVVGWYFRAMENGVYNLKFSYDDKTFEKRVVVSDKIPSLQGEMKQPVFLDKLYSVEPSTLQTGGPVEAVRVSYKKVYSPIGIFGWHPDWLYSFIIIFLLLFFALRPIAKVY